MDLGIQSRNAAAELEKIILDRAGSLPKLRASPAYLVGLVEVDLLNDHH